MEPVDDLRQATRLRFDIAFHSKIGALGITVEEKDRATPGICVTKPAGKLEFLLNTKFLRIKALQSDFDILFKGEKLGLDTVRWDAELPDGKSVEIQTKAGSATITQIDGTLFTTVKAIAPPLSDASCDGTPLGMIASWQTPDDTGHLHAEADASLGTATIDVTKLTVTGTAGDREDFAVKIKQYPHSECVAAAVEGQPASFFALVTGVPPSAPLSYEWTIDGPATAIGSNTSASFKASMPSPPDAVTVSVKVTVTQANTTTELADSHAVAIIMDDIARSMGHFCRLFMQAPINQFVRPLWDPLRDLVTRPVTTDDVKALQAFAHNLAQLGTRLAEDRSRIR